MAFPFAIWKTKKKLWLFKILYKLRRKTKMSNPYYPEGVTEKDIAKRRKAVA
jgi:hypothetical protein